MPKEVHLPVSWWQNVFNAKNTTTSRGCKACVEWEGRYRTTTLLMYASCGYRPTCGGGGSRLCFTHTEEIIYHRVIIMTDQRATIRYERSVNVGTQEQQFGSMELPRR